MKKPLMTLGMEEKPEMKSPIDSMIVDLIMEHYNIQSFKGRKENLSGDQFMEIVEVAEAMYYEKLISDGEVGLT